MSLIAPSKEKNTQNTCKRCPKHKKTVSWILEMACINWNVSVWRQAFKMCRIAMAMTMSNDKWRWKSSRRVKCILTPIIERFFIPNSLLHSFTLALVCGQMTFFLSCPELVIKHQFHLFFRNEFIFFGILYKWSDLMWNILKYTNNKKSIESESRGNNGKK